jgi:hypothetical protein
MPVRDKQSSLLCRSISDEEKTFFNIYTRDQFYKTVVFVTYEWAKENNVFVSLSSLVYS